MALPCHVEAFRDELAQRLRLDGHGAAVLLQHPARELAEVRVLRREDAVLDRSALRERALDPPGGVARDLELRLPPRLADQPLGAVEELRDVELRREPEVALAAGREADLPADPRDAERALVLAVEILANDVPGAPVEVERERVERPLFLLVLVDGPVAELHGALLRDRRLELAQAARKLGRVVPVDDLDARRRAGGRLREPGAAEREVLQRQAQRLGVRELPLEHVERRLERRELVVRELELVEEVALGSQRVQLLAGELVAVRIQRDAKGQQLRAVRVEAPRERLVRHLLIALDVRLDVARRDRPPFRHQERDQRELADQLVGVVAHAKASLADARPRPSTARDAGARGSSRARAAVCAGTASPCGSSPGSGPPRRRTPRPRSAPR